MNINKNKISEKLNDEIGISKIFCKKVTDEILNIFTSVIIEDGSLNLVNFGSFKIKNKTPRFGRNPKNKKVYEIKKRKVIIFKSSKSLLDYVN